MRVLLVILTTSPCEFRGVSFADCRALVVGARVSKEDIQAALPLKNRAARRHRLQNLSASSTS